MKIIHNVKLLILINNSDIYSEQNISSLEITQIKSFNQIVNISNIKHLGLRSGCDLLPSSILVLLKELPCVSSLRSDKYTLKTIDKDHELCEYLN